MKTILKTTITVNDICEGFVYNKLEGKGLGVRVELQTLKIVKCFVKLTIKQKEIGRILDKY